MGGWVVGGMQALLRSLHKIPRLGYVRDARPRLEPSGEAASLWGAWRHRVPSLSLLFKQLRRRRRGGLHANFVYPPTKQRD